MPSKSEKQHNFAAMSKSPKGRKKLRAKGKKPMDFETASEFITEDKKRGRGKR